MVGGAAMASMYPLFVSLMDWISSECAGPPAGMDRDAGAALE
jgi:hypothetical protein